jgi:hypothetical protein
MKGEEMLKGKLIIVLLLVAIVSLFTYTEAGAVADCDGTCSSTELAKHDCGVFGSNVIEFCGANSATCTLDVGGTAPCTVFFYRYTGGTTNQVNVAIPKILTQVLNDAADVNCSQYITDGSGDPTTGFGKGFVTLGICRVAPNAGSFPGLPNPPGANFYIATDPSFTDKTTPLNWQVRQSKNEVYNATVVGPVTPQPPVAETGATLTTKEGTGCSYRIDGGQVVLTDCPTGAIIDKTKLCLPTASPADASFIKDGVNWKCETISYVTEQCDVKTTGSDPCRYIGSTCIKY